VAFESDENVEGHTKVSVTDESMHWISGTVHDGRWRSEEFMGRSDGVITDGRLHAKFD